MTSSLRVSARHVAAAWIVTGWAFGMLAGFTLGDVASHKPPPAPPSACGNVGTFGGFASCLGKSTQTFPGDKLNTQLTGSTCVDWKRADPAWIVIACF